MKLIINSKEEHVDPTTAVRWCLCPEDFETIKKRQVLFPKVLLIVARGRTEEKRYLVPLDQTMQYVSFQSPGDQKIHAQLVYHESDKNDDSEIVEYFSDKRPNGKYVHEALQYNGVPFDDDSHMGAIRVIASTTVTVDVPSELFAPDPPEWEQELMDGFFKHPALDQCQYRRRRLLIPAMLLGFAFVIVITTTAKIVYALALFAAGMRNIQWKAILNFGEPSCKEVWEKNDGSIYFFKADGTPRLNLVPQRIRVWHQERKKRAALTAEEKTRRYQESQINSYAELVCSPEKDFRPTIESLPREKQTIYLRFQDLKARVCKPFAQL